MNFDRLKAFFLKGFPYFVGVLLLERIYTPNDASTGDYNRYITVILVLLLTLYNITVKTKFTRRSLVFLGIVLLGIVISQLALQGELKESFRYISLLLIAFLAGQADLPDLQNFCRVMVIISLLFTLPHDNYNELNRATGYLLTSPTLFSYSVLIALTCLIFKPQKSLDYILILIGFWVIIQTGTRSTFLAALVFVLISWVQKFTRNTCVKTWLDKMFQSKLFVIALLIGGFVFISGIFFVIKGIWEGTLLGRKGGVGSSLTRLKFIFSGIEYLNSHPIYYLVGSGAGASFNLITNIAGRRVPIHFDLLAVLIDYGVPGLLAMILLPLFLSKKWSWQGWVLLFLGSIHNLILFPVGLALVVMLSKQLKTKEEVVTNYTLVKQIVENRAKISPRTTSQIHQGE